MTWSAKVLAGSATPDFDVPMKISIARCAGCFTFEANDDGEQLATLTFTGSKLTGLRYSGFEAVEKTILKVGDASPPASGGTVASPPASGGSVAAGGSCSLVCSEQLVACKSAAIQTACTSELFDAIPRCLYTLSFVAGGRCAD